MARQLVASWKLYEDRLDDSVLVTRDRAEALAMIQGWRSSLPLERTIKRLPESEWKWGERAVVVVSWWTSR